MSRSFHRQSTWQRGLIALAIAAGSVALSACAEEVVAGPRWRGEAVAVAPPAAEAEVIGIAPHRGWVYQPGYWDWEHGRHIWIKGSWVEGRAGYRWVPHTWVHEGGGWRLREGYWAKG
jgi:hypothetical protein